MKAAPQASPSFIFGLELATVRRYLRILATVAVLTFGATLVGAAHARLMLERTFWPRGEARPLLLPPGAARLLSAGYNELFADLFWSRLLVYYGDGIARGTSLSDVEPLVELVNQLDPSFRRPYLWGAYATTFREKLASQAEYRSSVAILERAIVRYPDDWTLLWVLGLRYYLDLQSDDPNELRRFRERGADLVARAMRAPDAHADLPLLASSLRTKLGQTDRALRELREMVLTTTDPAAREKLLERYRALSAGAVDALAAAAETFERDWRAAMPYAPASLFVLVGPRSPRHSAATLAAESDRLDATGD